MTLTAIKNSAGEMCLQMENPYEDSCHPLALLTDDPKEAVDYVNDMIEKMDDFNRNNPKIPISGFALSEGDRVEEGEVEPVWQFRTAGPNAYWANCDERMDNEWADLHDIPTRQAYIRIPAKEEQKDIDVPLLDDENLTDKALDYYDQEVDGDQTAYVNRFYQGVTHTRTDLNAMTEQRDELLTIVEGLINLAPLLQYPADTLEPHQGEAIAVNELISKAKQAILKAHGK